MIFVLNVLHHLCSFIYSMMDGIFSYMKFNHFNDSVSWKFKLPSIKLLISSAIKFVFKSHKNKFHLVFISSIFRPKYVESKSYFIKISFANCCLAKELIAIWASSLKWDLRLKYPKIYSTKWGKWDKL